MKSNDPAEREAEMMWGGQHGMSCRMEDGAPRWMSQTLQMAAIYHWLWGAVNVVRPDFYFQLVGVPPLNATLWQWLGMMVAVYGFGYAIAAVRPYQFWPIVLVGLLGKVLEPIGFLHAWWGQQLPLPFGWTLLINDVVWWIPFGAILWQTARQESLRDLEGARDLARDALIRSFPSEQGETLAELSAVRPVMVVFLRHLGCTFAREALDDLGSVRQRMEALGVGLVVVYPEEGNLACRFNATEGKCHWEWGDVAWFSDPQQRLYRAFGLGLGSMYQLMAPRVILRGLWTALIQGHGFSFPRADVRRMPGVFVLWQGEVLAKYVFRTAADRPDYEAIAEQALRKKDGLHDPIPVSRE